MKPSTSFPAIPRPANPPNLPNSPNIPKTVEVADEDSDDENQVDEVLDTGPIMVMVIGRVVSVSKTMKGRFRIYAVKSKEVFDCTCPNVNYYPINEGDVIEGLARCEGNHLIFDTPPIVQIAIDRDSIVRTMLRVLRKMHFGSDKAFRFFDYLKMKAGSESKVAGYISELAELWRNTHDSELLMVYEEVIDGEILKKWLTWWYSNQERRRLYLLGLRKKEVKKIELPLSEIYDRCLKRPLTLLPVPMEKCESMITRRGKEVSELDRLCGFIARKIYEYTDVRKWTGVPSKILLSQFPQIGQLMPKLKEDYELKGELNTIYLPKPYRVETTVSNFIEALLKRPSRHFTVEMANFLRSSITEDQKVAVAGAISQPVSIIRGIPGSGKCLGPDVPVLFYNGSIKPAKEVQVGDLLMGDDSTPRKVLSICSGEDEMFEIIPLKGRKFICNRSHILTLKGIVPYIRPDKNRYIVFYTVTGIETSKPFVTMEEANKFAAALPVDIFDISLDEYLKLDSTRQQKMYLHHVGVDFPARPVVFDPYIIGLWLGDEINGDEEIIKYLAKKLPEYDLILTENGYQRYRTIGLGEKNSIPDIYKINSREVRLKVLAGIIDKNGYNASNYIEIVQKSNKLTEDIEFLALSLGFMVTSKKCVKSVKGEECESEYNRITIFGEGLEEIPVLLERKKCRPYLQKKRAEGIRFGVKPLGKGIYNGFTLDCNGRFLLGDFLVTHNSSTLAEIVHNLELLNISYLIVSFTGKAVARVQEILKRKLPMTLHRSIAMQRSKTIPPFDHLIIDETSMVTTELFYDFIVRFNGQYSVTFIGDENQLEPIGWGCLFDQLLLSKRIPTYTLIHNHRTSSDGIILNSKKILRYSTGGFDEDGEPLPPFEFVGSDNFFIQPGTRETVFEIVGQLMKAGVSSNQITVLTPFKKEIPELNKIISEMYNGDKRWVRDSRGNTWRLADRVSLTKNRYDILLMNGEEGQIVDVIEGESIKVLFKDGTTHTFCLEPTPGLKNVEDESDDEDDESSSGELTVLCLRTSFAMTVHISQGSEYDFVLYYVPDGTAASSFLNRRLTYTAITRAKRACWLVGDIHAIFQSAIQKPAYRCDNLAKRLIGNDITVDTSTKSPVKVVEEIYED